MRPEQSAFETTRILVTAMSALHASHDPRIMSEGRPLQDSPRPDTPLPQSPHDNKAPVGSRDYASKARGTIGNVASFRTRNTHLQPPASFGAAAKRWHPEKLHPLQLAPVTRLQQPDNDSYEDRLRAEMDSTKALLQVTRSASTYGVTHGGTVVAQVVAAVPIIKPKATTCLQLRGGCISGKGWYKTPEKCSYANALEACQGCFRPFHLCSQTTTYVAWQSNEVKYCGDCWNAYLNTFLVVGAVLQPQMHTCGVHTCSMDLASVPWFALEGDTYCPSCSASYWAITGTFTVNSI